MTVPENAVSDEARARNVPAEAGRLAEGHLHLRRAPRTVRRLFEPSPFPRALERARRRLGSRAGEWFLDNYYFIRRVARQVSDELPRGFLRHLPQLASGPDEGMRRIDALARALLTRGMELDATALGRFIEAYQQTSPLAIAELWALPTMLRAAALQQLLDSLALVGSGPGPTGNGVERSVRALRFFAEVNWKAFFERHSQVEAILRKDPAHVYERMDFDTCDSYRKRVEDLAWSTGALESHVAVAAVTLAESGRADGPEHHVGYFLVSGGQSELEQRLGYLPHGLERMRRALKRRPTLAYLSSLTLFMAVPLGLVGWVLAREGTTALSLLGALVLTFVPASVAAATFVHAILARVLHPSTLPKLDLSKGIPDDARTLVVIPALLGRPEDVVQLIRQVDLHYLANPDPALQFALLTDYVDSEAPPQDSSLLERAVHGIEALNMKYGKGGSGPFHLLHRTPKWNASEGCFMGWERKRGKLLELNRLLRGDRQTSYSVHIGDPRNIDGIRFVLTLDSDTQLPMGSAHRLVGLLAHPLNRATFDVATGRVASGYTVVQPRIETSPSAARTTRFSQFFSGDVGYDIYTHACSDLYQDLFGSGIYVGKGIYDVDGLMQSVDGRVPENTIISHDLFEGALGRAALATDIVLFESYPSRYAVHARRLHRWVRGDWQLLPWLFPRVPSASGPWVKNPLRPIDRWKIADNLRRSLVAPTFVLLLTFGWLGLPGRPLAWTLGALALFLVPVVPSSSGDRRQWTESLSRWALSVTFLAHEACVVADAMVRVVVRSMTRRHLLQWTCAAHTERSVRERSPRSLLWTEMISSPLLAGAVTALVAAVRPSALFVAAPILGLWLASPEVARWTSEPVPSRDSSLPEDGRRKLRRLARRTWLFFETFVGPHDQWLPIDNYQEQPHRQTAHRTSPTNIGMLLLSTLSAHDFGYIGPSELSLRLRRTLESVSRLAHYQGHLLNWYDTRSLEPLLPRYVSTVDSGNFAGCLLTVKQSCRLLGRGPLLRSNDWDGLADLLDLLEEVFPTLSATSTQAVRTVVARMRRVIARAQQTPDDPYPVLGELDGLSKELDGSLFALLETRALRSEAERLLSLRLAIEHLHQQLQQMRRELDALVPWLGLRDDARACEVELPTDVHLDTLTLACESLRDQVDRWEQRRRLDGALSEALEGSARRLRRAAEDSAGHARTLCAELEAIADRADEEVRAMDFRLLYDVERKLFRIGFNVTVDRVDPNYYDLLASEARLASYLAIVKGDVPVSHWFALGRPMTRTPGGPLLLSWGGTMFEYLMPSLLMQSHAGTLLAQTCASVTATQIAHGEKQRAPWGVSESAYARLDEHETYQYRSFGVPGLGFKRDLEDDRVVAPYASALALSIRPRAVVRNFERLEAMGMLGLYGMFEALDLGREGPPEGRGDGVVRSYMAHHQGMLLVAIDNVLHDEIMVDRFHSEPLVETAEFLLNERPPVTAPREWPDGRHLEPVAPAASPPPAGAPLPWSVTQDSHARAFVLSNGHLTSLVTAGGGGGLLWRGLALTRYQPDPSRPGDGLWLYVRDEQTGRLWRATSNRGTTTYSVHRAEFHRRNDGISVHVDVTVAAAEDVEIRQVTLRNETSQPRRLTVTSSGEPALVPAREVSIHPAFSKMFIESDWDAGVEALIFSRRPRSADETHAVLVHRVVHDGPRVKLAGYESDRGAFLGRGADEEHPGALMGASGPLRGRVGAVLDPIMSIMAAVDLAPNGTATLAFITTVAPSRSAALDLARRYGAMHAVRWSFGDAAQWGRRQLQRAELDPQLLPFVECLYSALLFAERAYRAPSSTIVAGRPCQQRLWSRGISGDDPILLVRVSDAEAPLVRETLSAQRYLRACGVRFDLVLVDQKASGYSDAGPGGVRQALVRWNVGAWVDRKGGVFVLVADQLSDDESQLLEASARVVLDTRDVSLAERFAHPPLERPELPPLTPTSAADASSRAVVIPELIFGSGDRGFTRDGREYVLCVRPGRPTPAPWCNVLANPTFGALVSESSLGCTWAVNSAENRLTQWRNDPVLDTPSEVLYLRDEESAAVWSSTPLPAGHEAETLVRHGAGYTTYSKECYGLRQELTVFVAHDAPVKVARLRLENTRDTHRRLTATYYAEWVLGSRREPQRAYVTSEIDRDAGCLLARCTWNAEFADRVAFLASERPVHAFTADRREFLGRQGGYAAPEGLARWGLSGRTEAGLDPCAALQVHLELAPGESIETHFVLGQARDLGEAKKLLESFRRKATVDAAWSGLGEWWDGMLDKVRVKTPEPAMDLLLNRWLLYQTLSSRIFGRTGFYQSSGAFGFRDQLQDVLALLHSAPERARAHILEAATHQFEEGDVLHWWHPPQDRGVRTRCSDDMAWLTFAASEYVRATGDVSLLSESVPFLTGAPLSASEHERYAKFERGASPASLFEHCRRALERASTMGRHGLPLMGDGDWNDGMNRVGAEGRGESVWLAWFLVSTMNRFAPMCTVMGDAAQADLWRRRARSLLAAVEECAWDGNWYVRAFHDDGSVLGSARDAECRIDSIAQSWAALSGAVQETRTALALASADQHLLRDADRVVLLLDPPFNSTRHDPGYIRAYPPGVRENGGQYTHAAAWLGCAHAALGHGESAARVFRLLNPILRTRTRDASGRYRLEPYVLAGDVYSAPGPAGRGGWSWYTGSAAWTWRLGVESILGITRERGELRINPHIPPSWRGFEAWLRIGTKDVHVVVENPDRVDSGIATMEVDGVTIDPDELRVAASNGKRAVEVRVRLGFTTGATTAAAMATRNSSASSRTLPPTASRPK